jgi:hypothetical protein
MDWPSRKSGTRKSARPSTSRRKRSSSCRKTSKAARGRAGPRTGRGRADPWRRSRRRSRHALAELGVPAGVLAQAVHDDERGARVGRSQVRYASRRPVTPTKVPSLRRSTGLARHSSLQRAPAQQVEGGLGGAARGSPCGRRETPRARGRARYAERTAIQTVPTGFSSLPPPGPAMPVMATATSARPRRARLAPSPGRTLAHGAVQASVSGVHAEQVLLRLVGVGHEAGEQVVRCAGRVGQPLGDRPPVQLSARASVSRAHAACRRRRSPGRCPSQA